MHRPRLSPAIAALAALTLTGAAPVGASAAQAQSLPKAATAAKAAPKKRTTSQRVTSLSRSLNRVKAQQRTMQKQIDALVKQQTAFNGTLSDAISRLTGTSTSLLTPAALLKALQDPATGIPKYLSEIQEQAIGALKALLASQEYAVVLVTVGDVGLPVVLPLISPDIPDVGAPVTVSGIVPLVIPGGLTDQRIDVRIGAISLENEKGGTADPIFSAQLGAFSVTPSGFSGGGAEATLSGGTGGVSRGALAVACTAGSRGCGAPVFSAPNPEFGGLPYWPITAKIAGFDGTKFGADLNPANLTTLTTAGKLFSVGNDASDAIKVTTPGPVGTVALLQASVSVTFVDASVNPADPLS